MRNLNGLRGSGVRPTDELLHGLNIFSQTLLWLLRWGIELMTDTLVISEEQELYPEWHDKLVPGVEGRLKAPPSFASATPGNLVDLPEHVGLREAANS